MKKYLILVLLFTGVIFQTQLFSYSGNIIGDTKCSEINETTRYSNLSPSIIEKIDAIGDGINQKYEEKDNLYKEKVYNLFEKVLNEHLQKTTYSGVQKEVLLRIGDYFVCKKENLNITQESLEIYNLEISNITDHGVKVTWEGNSKAKTWVYVKKTGSTGQKNDASNNIFEYNNLGADYEFTLSVQGLGGDTIKEVDFKTLSKNIISEEIIINNTEEITIIQNITTETIINTGENKYLEEVILPKCDASNPEVHFIKTNDDWKYINDENKRIFCVSPGDYRDSKQIELTTSGTKEKRRYIVLNNGNNIHPGKLDKIKLANYALNLKSVSYWTIDRAAAFDVTYEHVYIIGKSSTHNIFNRMYFTNTTNPIRLRNKAHYNTIQNCYFNGLSFSAYNIELGAIYLEDWEDVNNIHGTKIINNEFINLNAIRLMDKSNRIHYYNGTIIDGNINEYNDNIRSDCGAATNFNPNGNCVFTEAFLAGLKAGSSNENEPIIISNNIVFGAKKSRTIGQIGATGDGILVYMGAAYVHIYNNVIFDSDNGITIADSYNRPYGTLKAQIYDNIIVNSGKGEYSSLRIAQTKESSIYDNLIKDPKGTYTYKCYYNHQGNFFGNNTVINPDGRTLLGTPNNAPIKGLETNKIYNTPEEAGYIKDYSFTIGKYTNSPRIITIPNVLKAEQNPYLNIKN